MGEKVKAFFKGLSWFVWIVVICIVVAFVYQAVSEKRIATTPTVLNFNNVKVGYVADTKEAFIIDRKSNVTIVILDEKLTEAIYVTKSADKDRNYTDAIGATAKPSKKRSE